MWIFLLHLQGCHRISTQVFIAAEWDQHLRAIVADALSLLLDNNWRVNKFQSKSIYVSDVDDLFSNEALILRQFMFLLPQNCRVFVIGGSPRTELTRGSSDQDLLGLAGPASCFFFTIHFCSSCFNQYFHKRICVFWWKMQVVCSLCIETSSVGLWESKLMMLTISSGRPKRWD